MSSTVSPPTTAEPVFASELKPENRVRRLSSMVKIRNVTLECSGVDSCKVYGLYKEEVKPFNPLVGYDDSSGLKWKLGVKPEVVVEHLKEKGFVMVYSSTLDDAIGLTWTFRKEMPPDQEGKKHSVSS